MSYTPRTDAKAQFFGFNPDEGEEFVQADFARQLERENAALRKERDSYRYRSEQIWGLRKEIQAALGVPADCEGEEALKRGLESIKLLRSAAVEVCALARVWATVWHDKLSTDSLQRFAELEQQILQEKQP